MYWFKKMIENASENGIFTGKDKPSRIPELMDDFYEAVENAEIFVFTPTDGEPEDLFDPNDTSRTEYRKELALPFKFTAFEMLGEDKFISVSHSRDQEATGVDVKIMCVLQVVKDWDAGDSQYFQFVFARNEYENGEVFDAVIASHQVGVEHMLEALLNRLDSQVTGTEAVKEKVRIGSGSSRRLHKIRRVIHVRPNTKHHKSALGLKRDVDWSHRFTQRGHWRHLGDGKIGKNRAGDYCVPGKTWVSEGIKGPEDKPLIKKTRVVE